MAQVVAGLIALAWLSCGPASAATVNAASLVTRAKTSVDGNRTTLELTLSDRAAYKVFGLAAPPRVVVDLADVRWRIAEASMPKPAGVISRLRLGSPKPGTARLVIDTAGRGENRRGEPDAARRRRLYARPRPCRHHPGRGDADRPRRPAAGGDADRRRALASRPGRRRGRPRRRSPRPPASQGETAERGPLRRRHGGRASLSSTPVTAASIPGPSVPAAFTRRT